MMKPLLAAALLLTLASGASALTLALRPAANVAGNTITVGDVVTVSPADPAPPELLGLSLGMAPELNGRRSITRETLAAIVAAKPEFGAIGWAGSETCVISRPSRLVNPQDLAGVILPELQHATGNEGQVRIEEFTQDKPVLLPAGQIGAQAQLSPTILLHPWGSATVNYYVNGDMVATSTVRFRWSWSTQAWAASRNIGLGEDYSPADFRLVTIDAIQNSGNYLSKLPTPAEQVLARPLPSGTLLVGSFLGAKKIIQRGEAVTVNYVQPSFKISMKGVAMQDGVRGQVITVKNTLSQRSLYAKVVDAETLEVVQ